MLKLSNREKPLHTASGRAHVKADVFCLVCNLEIRPRRNFPSQPGPESSTIDFVRSMRTQNDDTFVGFQGQPSGFSDFLKNEENPLSDASVG